ncbi:1144_t:CDS:2 [Entrophospora sp. SA101]|nr:1144_t:CDS:2 [Entrophospora sp. SA101]
MSCMYTYCNNNNNIVIGSSSNYSTIITPSSSCSHSPLKLDPNALSLATKIDFDTQYRNLLTNTVTTTAAIPTTPATTAAAISTVPATTPAAIPTVPGAARRNSTTPAAISTVPETTQAAIPTQQLQESKKLQQQRFQVLQPPQQQFQQQQTGIPLLQQTNTYPTNSSSRHNCTRACDSCIDAHAKCNMREGFSLCDRCIDNNNKNCSFKKPHKSRGRPSKNKPKMNETKNSNSNDVNVADNAVNDTHRGLIEGVKNIIESGNEDLQVNPQGILIHNVDLVNGRVMREGGFISLSSGIEDLQVYPRQSQDNINSHDNTDLSPHEQLTQPMALCGPSNEAYTQGGNHRSTEGCVLPTSTYNHQTNDQQQSSHDDYYDTYLYTYEQLMQSSGVVIDPAVQTPP